MKKLMALVAMVMAVSMSGNVMAHGEKPKFGGVVSSAGDLHFELVSKDGSTTIYVEDHGKPRATSGATGKLTVLNGAEKTETPLEAAGENTLVAKGETKLAKGAKAVATVTFADKKVVNARFSIK